MRHSSIELSGPQTYSSIVQGGPWSPRPRLSPTHSRRNLRSPGSLELDPNGLTLQASVFPRPFLRILAVTESHGLIAKKSPPRLSRPSASCRHVARDGGFGDAEPEHPKFTWIRGAPQRKFSRAICAIRWRTSMETLGRPPRQRPRARYRQSADQPSRRQRKTVSGWTMSRLSRHWGHKSENKIQKSRSQRRKHGRRVPLRSSTAI